MHRGLPSQARQGTHTVTVTVSAALLIVGVRLDAFQNPDSDFQLHWQPVRVAGRRSPSHRPISPDPNENENDDCMPVRIATGFKLEFKSPLAREPDRRPRRRPVRAHIPGTCCSPEFRLQPARAALGMMNPEDVIETRERCVRKYCMFGSNFVRRGSHSLS